MNKFTTVLPVMVALLLVAPSAFAQDGGAAAAAADGYIAIGAGLTMGLAALGGTLGQGNGVKAALDGIARNPQASGKITTPMFAGLAFIESLVIFSFVIAFFLQGKIG